MSAKTEISSAVSGGSAATAPASRTDRVRAQEYERQSLVSLVNILRSTKPSTRLDLEREARLGRAVVIDRLATLSAFGLVDESGRGRSIGGRVPRLVRFRSETARILVANIDSATVGVGLADLKGQLILEHYEDLDATASADAIHDRLEALFNWILSQNDAPLWAIALGLPGAVEGGAGSTSAERLAVPTVGILPPWNDAALLERLVHKFRLPIWVRSAVQMETIGEASILDPEQRREMLFVELGTEIGAGLITDGQLHRGAQGIAGMIGHIYVGEGHALVCGCGNIGCLQTIAGGEAVAREGLGAARAGHSWPLAEVLARTGKVTVADVGNASRLGDPFSADLLAQCGRLIGRVLASVVNILNPSIVVIGGELAQTGDICLAAIREGVYRHAQPLLSRDLAIRRSRMGRSAGLVGAATVAIEEIFSPGFMENWITSGSPVAHPQVAIQIAEAEQAIARRN